MSDIKKPVVELSEALIKELKYNKDTHVVEGDNIYEKHLPEGLTMEVVDSVDQYNSTFIAGTARAVGHIAIEHMANEKTLDQVTAEFSMGKRNLVSHIVTREKTFTNPVDPSKPITKMGDISSTYSVHAGKNQGELKKVRNELHELAMSKMSK